MIVLVYTPTDFRPDVRVFDAPPSQAVLEQIVGGEIEALPDFDIIEHNRAFYQCVALCDSDAERRGSPLNSWATSLWHIALLRKGSEGLRRQDGTIADWLSGNVAVVYRQDAAYPRLATIINQPPVSPSAYVQTTGGTIGRICEVPDLVENDQITAPSFSQARFARGKTAAMLENAVRNALR
jgi:hypothetical protein